MTFHPCLPDIKSTFKNFNYINYNNDNLLLIFKEPLLIIRRRCQTLGNILSKTSLTQNTESKSGFYHCNRPNCSTCEHSTCKSNFTLSTNNKSYNILRAINYDSTNIIYLISCSPCNKKYIGETGRKLKYRFTEPLRDIRKKEDTAVATHFNQPNHTTQDIVFTSIDLLFK